MSSHLGAAWGGEVTPALNQRVGPFLAAGEAALDFSRLQEVLRTMVAASVEGDDRGRQAHLDELAGDGVTRKWRDQAVTALAGRPS